MFKKILFLSVASAAVLAFSRNTKADDAYVDLSVLNGLAQAPSYSSEPLFPVVKKSEAPKAVKSKSKSAPVAKKAALAPVKPVVVEAPKPVVAEAPVKQEVVAIPDKADIKIDDIEPIEGVKTEAAPAPEATPAVIEPVVNEQQLEEPAVVEPSQPSEKVAPVVPATSSESLFDVPAEATPAEPAKQDVLEPLIPASDVVSEAADTVNVPNKIIFNDNESELTYADKEVIDVIISRFEDPKAHKIGITAYNFEDGQDAFRKKRQSLNRAVEIRSYLLSKGYKNYSIKVVNISDDISKKNVVEIEEIK